MKRPGFPFLLVAVHRGSHLIGCDRRDIQDTYSPDGTSKPLDLSQDMVLIIDGKSEIGAHVKREIGDLAISQIDSSRKSEIVFAK